MASVEFKSVNKIYGGSVRAVKDLNLAIQDREFMVLVGPSGCGKTTALRMIAGLEEISEGEVVIGEKVVNDVPPKDRDIAMVFQNYALYPHMNVYDNIAFGLRIRELKGLLWQLSHYAEAQKIRADIDSRVKEVAKMLDILHLLDRLPKQLSGGQRQRVALARAIVRKPKVFLMDEPLSNLDAKLRIQTRSELIRLHRTLGITTVYVTHDQVEAMTMGQRIAIMSDGILQQCDTPEKVYSEPANKFVAGFIGSPPINFLAAKIVSVGASAVVDAGDIKFPIPPSHPAASMVGRTVTLGIRPEAIFTEKLAAFKTGPENTFEAKIDVLELLGHAYVAYLTVGEHMITATIDNNSDVKEGETAKFAIKLNELHLFDDETGAAIRETSAGLAGATA